MKPKQKPFRFFLRREASYELSMSVRFEVAEGYGALVLQRKDANKDPNPTLVYEEREVSAKELRGGRFIHVLPGSSRRQSYALSRLSEEMLQQLPEDGWTELNALTEYGFRYLVTPENLPASTKAAAVQVSTPSVPGTVVAVSATAATPPAAARTTATPAAAVRAAPAAAAPAARVATVPPRPAAPAAPPPDSENSEATDESPTAQGPALKAQSPGGAPSALQRAMAAIRAGRATGGAITGNTEALRNTPRPAPTAKVSSPGMTGKATKPPAAPAPTGASAPVTTAELDHLGHAEAIAMVKDLAVRLADLEKKYAEGLARERDLLDMLTRWQQRQIGN